MRGRLRVSGPGPALACFVALACGGGGSDRHVVEMRGFAFDPRVIDARVGDTIEFVNRDVVLHTATEPDGGWDSGRLEPDSSWSLVVTDRGVQSYVCVLHPSMTGRIDVR